MSYGTTPAHVDDFVQLSALLTGFTAEKIAPALDPSPRPLKELFFNTARDRTGAALDDLVAQFVSLATGREVAHMTSGEKQVIGLTILAEPHSPTAMTAQAITKMWYLGSWYQPFDFTDSHGVHHARDLTVGEVVSKEAYTKGLSWQVMQSHAMGKSPFTYGYWDHEPEPPHAFTGQPAPQGGQS